MSEVQKSSETANSWKEYRRFRAVELHELGWTMEKIAEAFDVTKGAVSQWCKLAREQGEQRLHTQSRPGPGKKLSEEEQLQIRHIIAHESAEDYGFHGNVWNCPRVVKLIQMKFGVTYHRAHVSKLLKKWKLTPQLPQKKKLKQNPKEVERWWNERWPQIQEKAEREGRVIIWVDESAFYLLPMVAKTYAPVGQTPEIVEFDPYKHISVISGITADGRLYMSTLEKAFDSTNIIQFLKHLYAHIQQKLLVIWDGIQIHRSKEVKEFLSEQSDEEIHLERQPGYSPELNPDEGIWNYLKNVELINESHQTIKSLKESIYRAFNRLRMKKDILLNIIRHSGYFV